LNHGDTESTEKSKIEDGMVAQFRPRLI